MSGVGGGAGAVVVIIPFGRVTAGNAVAAGFFFNAAGFAGVGSLAGTVVGIVFV